MVNELDLSSIREIQLEILVFLDQFFANNSINYSIAHGTALGAIRHKGYIPWDDDIDILLSRENYNKFIILFKENEYYDLIHYKLDSHFISPFAKVYCKSTLLIENTIRQPNYGVNIDVFPLDYLPKGVFREYMTFFLIKIIRFTVNLKSISSSHIKSSSNLKKIVFYGIKTTLVIFPFSLLNLMIEWLAINKENLFIGNLVWGMGNRDKHSNELFSNYVSVRFENHEFSIMIGFKEYLTNLYDDYMTLPNIEDQISRHSFSAFMKE
jgi:lipopolysaccharide cholinephosphotransferase